MTSQTQSLATRRRPPDRRELADQLVSLQLKIAPQIAIIEDLKQQLRIIAAETGEGFVEKIAGKGEVAVKAGAPREFRGIMPELDPAVFLGLSESRRQKL